MTNGGTMYHDRGFAGLPYERRAKAALDAFMAEQRASWLAFQKANPELAADMRQVAAYDAALRRQAFFNGLPVPKHRRA